jgi:hypothetical protein
MDFAHKSREKLTNALNNQEIATFITTLNSYSLSYGNDERSYHRLLAFF